MAGTITYDSEGSGFSIGVNGNQWQRRYTVDGLLAGVSPLAPNVPALIAEVLVLTPDTGTAAPPEILNMFVRDVTVDRVYCVDDNPTTPKWAAEGVITYTTPTNIGGGLPSEPDSNGPGITVSTSSSVTEIDVFYQRDGTTQLTTTYDGAVQAHRGTGFEVSAVHVFGRLEPVYPRSRIDNYTGRLNNALWNGYAAETVFCSGIDGRTDDGSNWFVTYTFEVRSSWRQTFVHDDPFFPGNPIPTSVGGPGSVLTADILPTANFSALNISLP